MKKVFALVTALACCFSLLVLPAAAQQTDILDEKFQQALNGLDFGYETYGSLAAYMVVKTNRTVFEDLYEDPWNHMDERLILQAKDYEEVLSRNFVPSAADLETIRTEGYGDILAYDEAEDTYTVKYPGGFGGALSARAYMGYVTTSEGFDVFYGKANYCFLADALPEGTTESEYAGALNYPAVIEYAGKQYENGPDGYYYLGSVEQTGMKYSVKVDGENVRIAAARKFTEEECPDSFEKLPEVDDDLKSIMSDIAELVKKYGPEIPDEVKNGTTKGTTCQYKPTKDSYYVAIGDDTAAVKDSYVNLLADGLKLSYKNLSEPEMRIEHADKAFLEANTSEIEKADLITIGFSVNGFATVAVEEALKNMDSSSSLIPWDRYLPEEAVPEIASIRERMKQYLIDNGMDGQLMGVPLRDALVTVAESLAFDTLAYINELPRLIDDIREINGNAQIVVVGMDNPMESSTLSLGADEKIELGVYVDQLINNMDNASQAVAIEKENTVFVSAPDALNKNDNKELTENALILSYINGIKSQAIPDEKGQAYIRNQIIKSMRKMGDVNSDGQVNYNDALVILRASINLVTLSEEDMLFADVDGKDGISYNDALKILRASIGLDTLD